VAVSGVGAESHYRGVLSWRWILEEVELRFGVRFERMSFGWFGLADD